MVKYLHFHEIEIPDKVKAKRTKTWITVVVILVIAPSIWSAFTMIRENKFNINVENFVAENKNLETGYIYDHKISYRKGCSVELFIAGEPLTASEKSRLIESAARHKINENQLKFSERAMYESDKASEKIMKGIYERTDSEIAKREARIKELEKALENYKLGEIPFEQIAKEIHSQYPQIEKMFIARGAEVRCDSLASTKGLVLMTESAKPLPADDIRKLESWLKIRLGDSTAVVISK